MLQGEGIARRSRFKGHRLIPDGRNANRQRPRSSGSVWNSGMMSGDGESRIQSALFGGYGRAVGRVLAAPLALANHFLEAIRVFPEIVKPPRQFRDFSQRSISRTRSLRQLTSQ
jgi:hypothetical protein